MWKNTRNVFYKTRAARNTGSKGNIDHSNSALAATDKIYVYILRSKCGKSQVMFSIKSVRYMCVWGLMVKGAEGLTFRSFCTDR